MSTGTTYIGILHRKNKGSLVLTDQGLCFRPESANGSNTNGVVLPWHQVAKHQVSPASHPKSLLKVVTATNNKPQRNDIPPSASSLTFVFPNRNALEGARRDVSSRLSKANGNKPNNKKRPREQHSTTTNNNKYEPTGTRHRGQSTPPSSHYINHDPVALIATRSSLLASDPALRAQHRLLVLDGGTLSEEDFWETHSQLVANEYAKISGKTNCGMSSDIKSSLDLGISSNSSKKGPAKKGGATARGGVVHLGVEEMRQIFIMYPAVHRAYEEKVPLELSEEQFWRKYLESEYFHRDRGRIGAHIGRVNERELIEQERVLGKKKEEEGEKDARTKKEEKKEEEKKLGEEEAKSRLAAATTDDIFSRYDSKQQGSHHHRGHHRQHSSGTTRQNRHRHHHHRKLGTQIAVGQFDLASTNEDERGDRFIQLKDLHPPPEKGSAGANIIDKYNRHWAIVLHPTESTAGKDLEGVAATSAKEEALANGNGEDAKVNGGVDREMRRLIGFADANEGDADFARGMGDDDEDLMELHLHNVDAYSGKFGSSSGVGGKEGGGESSELHLTYARYLAAGMRAVTAPILLDKTAGKAKGFCNAPMLVKPLPDPRIGRGLLEALTKKMAADSRTEADVQRLADELPEEFKTKLATFFRRSTELLRHFFSLRSVFNENEDGNGGIGPSDSQKNRLTNIVKGMEKVHGEMYALTRNLTLMESKMFKPIMDQLDWAFKLHREDSSKSSGGFVTVARGGFVSVAH
eukprot:CAMPEP_0196160750 /NCGR_PEP_ID=MMETSP0910-20130528/46989_1 /TAXON_ID=49265 /ORGANISM="Thalassiosira rotula, Strain GSO102" /LENGTH=748 /DNA_ID=CAMNT_0041425689 /DNA_START=1 /DNA_END=2247 /DNA_ORIENTATION=+